MSDDLKKLLHEFANDKLDDSQRRLKRAMLAAGMTVAPKEGSFGVLRRSLLAGIIASTLLVVDDKVTHTDLDERTRRVIMFAAHSVASALAKQGKRVCRSAGPITEPSSAMAPPPPVAKSGKAPAKPAVTKSAISKQQHLPFKKRR